MEAIARLTQAGYRTVVDLRSRLEDRGFDEEKVTGKAKMAYTNVEVTPDTLTQSKVLFFLMMLREAELGACDFEFPPLRTARERAREGARCSWHFASLTNFFRKYW